jgi:hypothetical protein
MVSQAPWRQRCRPGFWGEPQAVPQVPTAQGGAQPTQSQPQEADQTLSAAHAGAVGWGWRRGPQPCRWPPLLGGLFNASAVRQPPERGHGQHQPVAGHAEGLGRPGLLPRPAHPCEGPEAQRDPHPQSGPAHAHPLGQHITRMVRGPAGRSRRSRRKRCGLQAPGWLAGHTCHATGIALPRSRTLTASTPTCSPWAVASRAKAQALPCHHARTQRRSGAKHRLPSSCR